MATKKPPSLKDMQIEQGKQTMPYYNPMLQWAAQNAGLPMGQMGQPMGQMGQPMGQMGQPMLQQLPTQQPMAQQPTANRFQGGGGGSGFGVKPSPQAQFASTQSASPNFGQAQQPMASTQPLGGLPSLGQQQQPMSGLMGGLMGQQSQSASPFGQAGPQNSEMGIYGSNPADVFRMQQADEEINRISGQRARMLQHRLGQQGIGNSGTMAAALGQNERSAMSDMGNFRRQMAINAGPEQERRMQILMQMMGMGQQQGVQGQNVYGQQQQISASKGSLLDDLVGVAGAAAPFFVPGGGMGRK